MFGVVVSEEEGGEDDRGVKAQSVGVAEKEEQEECDESSDSGARLYKQWAQQAQLEGETHICSSLEANPKPSPNLSIRHC